MLAFLSPAWVAALADAVRDDRALAHATAGVDLVIEQHVTAASGDETSSDVTYHVVFSGGRVAVVAGPAETPTIRFTQDHATAWGIAAGTDSAQRAFMTGRLQVGGDLRVLLEHQEAMAALHDVFADVRARTDLVP